MLPRGHRVRGLAAGPAGKGMSEPEWDRLRGGAGRPLIPVRGFPQQTGPGAAATQRLPK